MFAAISLLCIVTALLVNFACAETVTTTQPFTISARSSGESVFYQNTEHASLIQWTVLSGSFEGTGEITVNDTAGTFTLIPSASCSVAVILTNAFTQVSGVYQTNAVVTYTSGEAQTFTWIYTVPTTQPPTPTPAPTAVPTFPAQPIHPDQNFLLVNVTGQGTFTINTVAQLPGYYYYDAGTSLTLLASPSTGWAFNYWLLGDGTNQTTASITLTLNSNMSALAVFQEIPVEGEPTPAPTAVPSPLSTTPPLHPDTLNVMPLWSYLFNGNFLGLLNAIYLSAFQIESIVVGVVLLAFFAPLYVKTKNLLLCSVCWILIGGFFITAVPVLSGLAVILLVLGVASLLYRLVRPS